MISDPAIQSRTADEPTPLAKKQRPARAALRGRSPSDLAPWGRTPHRFPRSLLLHTDHGTPSRRKWSRCARLRSRPADRRRLLKQYRRTLGESSPFDARAIRRGGAARGGARRRLSFSISKCLERPYAISYRRTSTKESCGSGRSHLQRWT